MPVAWNLGLGKSGDSKRKEEPDKVTKVSKDAKVAANGTLTNETATKETGNGSATAKNSVDVKNVATPKAATKKPIDVASHESPSPASTLSLDKPSKVVANAFIAKKAPTPEAPKDKTQTGVSSKDAKLPEQAPQDANAQPSPPVTKRGRLRRRFSRSATKDVILEEVTPKKFDTKDVVPKDVGIKDDALKVDSHKVARTGGVVAKNDGEDVVPSKPSTSASTNGHARLASHTGKDRVDPDTGDDKLKSPTEETQLEAPPKIAFLIEPPSDDDAQPDTEPANAEAGPSIVIKPSDAARALASTRDILSAASLSRQGRNLPNTSYPESIMSTSFAQDKLLDEERSHIKRLFVSVGNEDTSTLVSLLTSELVSPNVMTAGAITPLVYAAARGLFDSTEALVMHSADLNLLSRSAFAAFEPAKIASANKLTDDMGHSEFRTPLMAAAENGRLRVVELLLQAGADDSIVAPDGQIALRLAISNGHREVAYLLPKRNDGASKRIAHQLKPARSSLRSVLTCFQILWYITFFLCAACWGLFLHACRLEESWANFCANVRADWESVQKGWNCVKEKIWAGCEWFMAYWPLLISCGEDVV